MATQKPISTISYNTEVFLLDKLNALIESHTIQAFQYIKHTGEDGDKDHIHLRIEPNKRLDPMELTDYLKEYVPNNPKPLGVRPWRNSKEEDWFLYAVHDKKYLDLKYGGGEKGEKIPYSWEEIRASADYDTEVAFIRAQASLKHSNANIAQRLSDGDSALSLIQEGNNPLLIGAISRAVADSDYSRVQREYAALLRAHEKLIQSLERAGLAVEADDEGDPVIRFPGV